MKKRTKNFYENKFNYVVGVSLGMISSALFLAPNNGTFPTRYRLWLILGAALFLIAGVYGSIARKKEE